MVDELELVTAIGIGFALYDDEKSGRPRPISNACKKSLLAPCSQLNTTQLYETKTPKGIGMFKSVWWVWS